MNITIATAKLNSYGLQRADMSISQGVEEGMRTTYSFGISSFIARAEIVGLQDFRFCLVRLHFFLDDKREFTWHGQSFLEQDHDGWIIQLVPSPYKKDVCADPAYLIQILPFDRGICCTSIWEQKPMLSETEAIIKSHAFF